MPLYEIDGRRPSLPQDGSSWIAHSADVIGDARIGQEVGIWFGAVIRADNTPIIIGNRTNIQEGAMLHSDPGSPLTIGAGCTVGHHAILHGCTLGHNVLVGMGATILNDAVIGDNCLVGAGALVTEGKNFPPGSLIIGAPAKSVRALEAQVIAALEKSASAYVSKQRLFAMQLAPVSASECSQNSPDDSVKGNAPASVTT
jgi:carbonic anhydrase/acetyltransferase-like protein (isoleucine patch superfamily)